MAVFGAIVMFVFESVIKLVILTLLSIYAVKNIFWGS